MHSNAIRVCLLSIAALSYMLDANRDIASAQQVAPLPVEDALKERSFGALTGPSIGFSPDGKWLAYVIQDNSIARSFDDKKSLETGILSAGHQIYLSNTNTGEAIDLTGGTSENWSPVWSPDGHYLAFLSDRDGSRRAKLWIWDATKNDLKKISDMTISRVACMKWAPDSRNILVAAVPVKSSEERHAVSGKPLPDKEKTVKSETNAPTVVLYQAHAVTQDEKEARKSDPWDLNADLCDLTIVEVATGKTSIAVRGKRIAQYVFSPDGSRIAYTIPRRFEKPGSQQILFDLVVLNLSDMKEQVLGSDIHFDYDGTEFSWSPDGTVVAYCTGGPSDNVVRDCYVVNATGGISHNITNFAPLQSMARTHKSSVPLWDLKGHFYFIREDALWMASPRLDKAVKLTEIINHRIVLMAPRSENLLWTSDQGRWARVLTHDHSGKEEGFYKIDLTNGQSTALLEKSQCYTCVHMLPLFAVSMDGQHLAYFAEDAQHKSDLWVTGPDFGRSQRLTHLNPRYDKYKMGVARLIDWLSDDGKRLQGALLLPADYQEGKRYPLVVYVYGGISLSDSINNFGLGPGGPFNMQLLATRGYAILLPDAPLNLGTPMFDLAKTVLPGVNKVIEMGIADPERLGVMGHSFGGYSTLSLIVQTKRFKAAIEADGYGDKVASFGEMNKDGMAYGLAIEEKGQGLMGGPPWEFRERYMENSPVFYLDRIETPLLIIHGANDTNVAPFLGDEMFVGLRRLSKDVEYAKYEGEGHTPFNWSYPNQVDFCNRVIGWFDKHLKSAQPPN